MKDVLMYDGDAKSWNPDYAPLFPDGFDDLILFSITVPERILFRWHGTSYYRVENDIYGVVN